MTDFAIFLSRPRILDRVLLEEGIEPVVKYVQENLQTFVGTEPDNVTFTMQLHEPRMGTESRHLVITEQPYEVASTVVREAHRLMEEGILRFFEERGAKPFLYTPNERMLEGLSEVRAQGFRDNPELWAVISEWTVQRPPEEPGEAA